MKKLWAIVQYSSICFQPLKAQGHCRLGFSLPHGLQGCVFDQECILFTLNKYHATFVSGIFVTTLQRSTSELHLHNYFNLNVCPSFRRRRRRTTFNFQIPAVVSQSVTNECCLICVKSEKYSFLGTTRPLGSMR